MSIHNIPFVDVLYPNLMDKKTLLSRIEDVINSGQYVLGENLEKFENEFAKKCGSKYAVGVNSGTDALILAMKTLGIGPGDEVITSVNSFIATVAAIVWIGAIPILVDVDDTLNIDVNLIEPKITKRTKAIIPVHYTGRVADMNTMNNLALKYNIPVIEDAAQAFGAMYYNKAAGTFGIMGCFSFFPTKNLSGIGDGGIIITDEVEIYKQLKMLRNFGRHSRDEFTQVGINSRLDEIQAVILMEKIQYFYDLQKRRLDLAYKYNELLKNYVKTPENRIYEKQAYHLYIITLHDDSITNREMEELLNLEGIQARIHYSIPIHLQKGYAFLGYKEGDFINIERLSKKILTLPLYPSMNIEDVYTIADKIRLTINERKGELIHEN